MSLFESFLGGAAEAGTSMLKNQMAQEQAEEQAKRMAKFQEEIAMERMKTVEALREQFEMRKEQRAQEPLNRMGSLIGSFRQQDVPMEPDKVRTLSGSGKTFDGQELHTGFNGKSPDEMRKILDAMPEGEDKVNAIKQLDNQIARDSATAMEAVAGKHRKMTTDEAEQAALEHAIANDPAAYAAYQRDIGAPRRADRRLDVADKRTDAAEKRADRGADLQRDQLDWTKEIQQRQLEQHAELQKIAQQRADAAETKAEARQRASTLSTIMRDAAMDAKELRTRMQDPMLDAASKKVYEQQLAKATESHSLAAAALLKDSGINPPNMEKKNTGAPPDGTRGTMNGVPGEVRNGVFVPDVQPAKKENSQQKKESENNYPVYKTFEPTVKATEAELSQAQQDVDAAKAKMDANRNAQTINAYNQAVTKFTALSHRGT